jgi:hypothetical protein
MTTGQPIRFPSDRNKYNNEFNEALQLQINLNQTNLEANRLYKQTGQLPASTQMMDTRSNEEKLADVHSLKQSIISDLRPIAEPMFASAVIQGVIDSPLNVDNSLFRYLAQNASMFAQTLSKKYKFGIAGDANDVMIMVQFLEDAYNKTKNSFQSIKGYINSNTNEGNKSRSNILSANDTDNVKLELINVIKRFEYINHTLAENVANIPAGIPNLIGALRQTTLFLAEVNSFLPTSNQMTDVINILANAERVPFMIGGAPPPVADRDLLLAVLKILKTIPRASSIATLLDMCDKALDNGDYGRLFRTIQNIRQLFVQFTSPENRQLLRDFRNEFLEKARIMEEDRQQRSSDNLVSEMRLQNEQEAYQKNAKRVYVINPANDPVNIQGIANLGANLNVGYDGGGGSHSSSGYDGGGGSQSSSDSNMSIPAGFLPQSSFNVSSTPSNQPVSSSEALSQAFSSINPFGQSSSSSSSSIQQRQDEYERLSDNLRDKYRLDPSRLAYEIQQLNAQYNDLMGYGVLIDPDSINPGKKAPPMSSSSTPSSSAPSSSTPPPPVGRDYFIGARVSGLTNTQTDDLYKRIFNTIPPPTYGQRKKEIEVYLKALDDYDPRANRRYDIGGLGLPKPVKKGRGLYSPFGDSEINHKNLENNILTLRRKSKTNYMDLPSKHISKHMKNILHSIVGGKIANFEDINNLNDEERNYLNKVISKSNLQDRLSVPAPSKDQADKDNHQWEVMRGEIMAGNDSKELVKKFKILTMKLTRQGLLPKNEVMELFEDLVNLGY